MVRKSLFKYILFALLMVFLFVPSVKASTTYLACEYAPTGNVVDSYYIDRVRVIVRNNKWVIDGARNKDDGDWSETPMIYLTEEAMQTYTDPSSANERIEHQNITECYDKIYVMVGQTIQGEFQLTGNSFKTTIDDQKCDYKNINDNTEVTLNLPSAFYGINSMSVSVGNTTKTLEEYLPIEYESANSINWQDISKAFYYLKSADMYSGSNRCPKAMAMNDDYVYITYSGGLTKNKFLAADKIGLNKIRGDNDSYVIYNLIGDTGFNLPNAKDIDCTDIFGDSCDKDDSSLMCFITTIFNILRYLIPAILIILGSIDFAKIVISSDREAMSKGLSTFVKRIIISIAIMLLPILINLIMLIFNTNYTGEEKVDCIIDSLTGGDND